MSTSAYAIPSSRPRTRTRGALWAGRVLTALTALFLVFDAVMHIVNPSFVVEASIRLGWAPALMLPLGGVELLCVAAYVFPRTSVLGAVLLTGYLGGATATQVRIEDPWFMFPVVVGALIWGALFLRDARLRALLPVTTTSGHLNADT